MRLLGIFCPGTSTILIDQSQGLCTDRGRTEIVVVSFWSLVTTPDQTSRYYVFGKCDRTQSRERTDVGPDETRPSRSDCDPTTIHFLRFCSDFYVTLPLWYHK